MFELLSIINNNILIKRNLSLSKIPNNHGLYIFNERDAQMKRKFHTPEQIVKKLREADAAIASGSTIEQICRQLEISDATYYNWRKQYGQMKLDQVKQLKSLQRENARLKKLVADLSLDKAILKEALSGNY
jgi:transposase-like protein